MAAQLGMFPLSTVLFPHAEIPLHIFEPRYRALAHDCLAADSRFGIVLIERGSEVGGGDHRMAVGTRVVITKSVELSDGRWLLLVRGEGRIRVLEWLDAAPYPSAMVEEWSPDDDAAAVDTELLARAVHSVRRTRGLLSESGESSAALSAEVTFEGDAERASWRLCAEAPLNLIDAQQLLAASGTVERLELLVDLVEAVEQDLHRMLASG
jgi:Lon protease-like protein